MAIDDINNGDRKPYQDLKWVAVDILNRYRLRPKWHDEYIHLEDACRSLLLEISVWTAPEIETTTLNRLLEEAVAATHILRNAMEAHLTQRRQQTKVNMIFKAVGSKATAQEAGTRDEQTEQLVYRDSRPLHQLSFHCRKRSRFRCFVEYVRMIRMVLERS